MQPAIPGPVPRRGVLITRPGPDAAVTAARIAALDRVPVAAPMLCIRTRPRGAPPPHDAVLLSSRNAIPALVPGPAPVFAVGDATATAAREAGFATVHSAGGTAADLVALVRARVPAGARLLLPVGAGQGGALAAALRGAGYRVQRRVAYAAVPVRRFPAAAAAALDAGTVGAAVFMSAETARAFVRLLPDRLRPTLGAVEALAIGAQAADVLALLPWRRVRVPVSPTLDQVLALL